MNHRIFEIAFICSAIALVGLVGLLNCLQGTPFLGGLKCNYTLTSNDLVIKLGASAVFLLFLALLLGPVLATIVQPRVNKHQKRS
ncbi:MAG TPA: hypothetical protein VEC43_00130 [Candidatus Acidoferrales bacterium]|nr:hypothetical protein [Candidatus Acidoferrales bacterium]